jgi:hypothetical protein
MVVVDDFAHSNLLEVVNAPNSPELMALKSLQEDESSEG